MEFSRSAIPYAFSYTTAPSCTMAIDRPGIAERSIVEATNASTRVGSTRASVTRCFERPDPDDVGRSGAAHVDASNAHTVARTAKPVRPRRFRITPRLLVADTDVSSGAGVTGEVPVGDASGSTRPSSASGSCGVSAMTSAEPNRSRIDTRERRKRFSVVGGAALQQRLPGC